METAFESSHEKDDPVPPVAKKPRTTTAAAIIRNPYAKKSSSSAPPISKKPIYGLMETMTEDSTVAVGNLGSLEDAFSHGVEDDPADNGISKATTRSTTDSAVTTADSHMKLPSQPTDHVNTSSTQARRPMSRSLPLWERLPSRNLSFGSAEMLSVTECIQHAALYNAHGRSIRCTGVVEEIIINAPKTHSPVTSQQLPHLSVRLSDPLRGVGSHCPKGNTDEAASLWALLTTTDQTAVVYDTGVGRPITVVGEPVPSHKEGWTLRVRLCLPVAATASLALQWEALCRRRRFLQQQCTTTVEAVGDDDEVPMAGWGPPPYTRP